QRTYWSDYALTTTLACQNSPQRHQSIATTSWSSTDGTVRLRYGPLRSTGGVIPADSNRTLLAVTPSGTRTRTLCAGAGINSRNGPFIIIGFVRFTRCTVIECFCRHAVTSRMPGPLTATNGSSLLAHSTAFRNSFR